MKKILAHLVIIISHSGSGQTPSDSSIKWSYHFQLTAISQGHFAFKAKYSGTNSLESVAEGNAMSVTSTLFFGRKLWKNAAIYGNAEIGGGTGLSSTRGVAGFPNGETYRIGNPAPEVYVARLYYVQYFPLKNTSYEKIEDDANQVEELIPTSRITLRAGKFSISDFYDNNSYSHNPRSQFMNWALMGNGAWDYPADTRGYTSGIVMELTKPSWAIRVSCIAEPKEANGLVMDYNYIKAQGLTLEAEKRWKGNTPGVVRLLVFRNSTQAPAYSTTLQEVRNGDSSDVAVYTGEKESGKYGGIKYGIGINAEQKITNSTGIFLKSSWNDGKTATWAFTEIDRTVSAGVNIMAIFPNRKQDNLGIAAIINGISKEHREFLNAGLYGFLIGDGKLNYGAESIAEIFYQARILKTLFACVDYQFISNPAYNKDRGPVHVYSFRVHIQF
jgi:hypothetical protein